MDRGILPMIKTLPPQNVRKPYAVLFVQFCSIIWQDSEVTEELVSEHFKYPVNLFTREAVQILNSFLAQPPAFVDMIYGMICEMSGFTQETYDLHIRECNIFMIREDTFEYILTKYPTMIRREMLYEIVKTRPTLAKYLFEMNHEHLSHLLAKLIVENEYLVIDTLFKQYEMHMLIALNNTANNQYFKLSLKSSSMVSLLISKIPQFWEKISIIETFKECRCHISILSLFHEQLATKMCRERNSSVSTYRHDVADHDYVDVLSHILGNGMIMQKYQNDHLVEFNLQDSRDFIKKMFF